MCLQYIFASIFILFSSVAFAQSTWEKVYNIFQGSCTFSVCHDNTPALDLPDLQGSGPTIADSMQVVYNNIFNQIPFNDSAQSKGYKLIYPGDYYRSFLFRKINNGFVPDINLDVGEGCPMPKTITGCSTPPFPVDTNDLELIRQWILFGAPDTGVVVDTNLIISYYSSGISSVPNPPAAPAPSAGFQIHFGPYFIAPGGETEYFLKFDAKLSDTTEINRVDVIMGDAYSHHFIIYRLQDGQAGNVQDGLTLQNAHQYSELVSVYQFSDSLILPVGTAFSWTDNTFLDLNSHHINTSPFVLGCEVYVNVYTQPKGWAKQIMNTDLILDLAIAIPNVGGPYTFEQSYCQGCPDNSCGCPPPGDIFLWALTSHTHQWGIDFDIYKRNPDGTKGIKYFDASHKNGDPNDTLLGYEYDRPPTRFFEPFVFISQDSGLIQSAVFDNQGLNPLVTFGLTSDDEMMIMIPMFVTDTTGLANAEPYIPPTGIENSVLEVQAIKVYPNPFTGNATFMLPKNEQGNFILRLYNVFGEEVKQIANIKSEKIILQRGNLSSGVYFYQVATNNKLAGSGKLIIY